MAILIGRSRKSLEGKPYEGCMAIKGSCESYIYKIFSHEMQLTTSLIISQILVAMYSPCNVWQVSITFRRH